MEIINYLKYTDREFHIVEHIGYHESGDYLLRQLFSSDQNGYRLHKYEAEKNTKIIDKSVVDALERQTCGRRGLDMLDENSPFVGAGKGLDYWQKKGDIRTCNYCGSLHPEDLFKLIEKHGFNILQSTDKAHKRYVQAPGHPYLKFYTPHLTKEQIDQYNNLLDNWKKPIV